MREGAYLEHRINFEFAYPNCIDFSLASWTLNKRSYFDAIFLNVASVSKPSNTILECGCLWAPWYETDVMFLSNSFLNRTVCCRCQLQYSSGGLFVTDLYTRDCFHDCRLSVTTLSSEQCLYGKVATWYERNMTDGSNVDCSNRVQPLS